MPAKKNPQDATRARDVAPLRRRIVKLEASNKELKRQVKELQDAVNDFCGTALGEE